MAYEGEHAQAGRREVAVIGDYPMTLGFRLAGVKEYSVVEEGDQRRFEAELARMLSSERISVIIAEQDMLANVGEHLRKRLQAELTPIVVGIPDKRGQGETGDAMRQMLKRSLGIEVKRTS